MAGLVDQIVGAESGGDPNSKNPNSSASGLGNFIDATWLDTLAKHRPDITGSRDDLLALKTDPALSREMTAAYAADNAGILSKSGLPVTPGTTYLAHFAGPQGAVGLLNADPSTPAAAVLGQGFAKANPTLAGYSAGQLAAWADRKMGGTRAAPPMSMAGPAAPAAASSAPVAPQQPTQPAPQQAAAPAQSAPASGASLDQLAAVPQLQNILPQRPNFLLGRYQAAPFSLRG